MHAHTMCSASAVAPLLLGTGLCMSPRESYREENESAQEERELYRALFLRNWKLKFLLGPLLSCVLWGELIPHWGFSISEFPGVPSCTSPPF